MLTLPAAGGLQQHAREKVYFWWCQPMTLLVPIGKQFPRNRSGTTYLRNTLDSGINRVKKRLQIKNFRDAMFTGSV